MRSEELPRPRMSFSTLDALLRAHNVPVDSWGTGTSKTPIDLLKEINANECDLREDGDELLRTTEALAINVFCTAGGKTYRLKEEKQVFNDGRIRVRDAESMDTSLGEKMTKGENREISLERAVREELNVDSTKLSYVPVGDSEVERVSNSYPGLKSRHTLHRYDLLLPESAFKPEGYIETPETKSTYFVWEEIDDLPILLKSFVASYAGQKSR